MKTLITSFLILIPFLTYSSFDSDFRGELPDAKSAGMGFVGSTLNETNSYLFFNPALLAHMNNLGIGKFTAAFETNDNFYPWFYFQNNYTYTSFIRTINSGYSFNFNYSLLSGVNEYYDTPVNGEYMKTFDNNYNLHFDFGIGRIVYKSDNFDHSLGSDFTLMYRHDSDDIGYQFGFDLGYLFKHQNGFGVSFCVNNMGNNFKASFGNELHYEIPIPFNVQIATGFENEYTLNKYSIKIGSEASLTHFMTYSERVGDTTYSVPFYIALFKSNYYQQNEMNIGYFITLLKTVHLSNGYILTLDKINSNDIYLKEVSFGVGISLFNHLDFNIAFNKLKTNYTDGTYFYENNVPFRFSFTITNALTWNKNDLKWWAIE